MAGPNNPFHDLWTQFLNTDPTAALYATFGKQVQGNDPYANFLRNSSSRFQGNFINALQANPNLQYPDYLKSLNPMADFQNLAPSQRGINYATFAPRTQTKYAMMGG